MMPISRLLSISALAAALVAGCSTEEPTADTPPDAGAATEDDVTPAVRESVLWQRYQAWRAEPTAFAAGAGGDSIQEYAANCDAAVGLHVPSFDCDAGTEPPGQGTVPAGTSCATPNVLNSQCDPGSKFQVLAQNADAAVVAHCRKVGNPIQGSTYGDIAVIQYNRTSGAVCFYQALGSLPGADVRAPSEGTWPHWISPAGTHSIGCTGCHDNGGFIRSPYLAQLKTGPNVLPSTAAGFDNLNTLVRYVGRDYANDRSWSMTAPAAACPPGESCVACTACHRLAANNVRSLNGTAADFAVRATAPAQASKFPHGPASPIWMRPGQVFWKAEAEQSALRFQACALGFSASGFTAPPWGCTATPLGAAAPSPIDQGARGDDIAVLGSSRSGAQLAVAFSNDDGSFAVTNTTGEYFSALARLPGVQRLTGDFNKDGRMDFALVGGAGWLTIPVAMSRGDGEFSVTNANVGPDFNAWARTPGVKALSGDFNKDGYADIALTGGAGWASIPIAFSTGGGTFAVTNGYAGSFGSWASTPGVQALTGDFNKDGYTDLALIGVAGWASIPVAFAAGGGSWLITNAPAPSIGPWSATANVKALTGDFNKDGYTDIALTGGSGWASIPVAFAAGGGWWQVTNYPAPAFGAWAGLPGVTPVIGDFNKDGYTDLALTGHPNWASIPVAFAAGGGSWIVTNGSAPSFGPWASTPGVRTLAGDFNGDGYTDLALTGHPSWASIPVAFSSGGGNFNVTNQNVTYFPAAASDPAATIVVGRVN